MATGDLFGGALADLYSRGLDISRDNPWALAQSAFPQAQASRPGITMADLLREAQDYFRGTVKQTQGADAPGADGVAGPTGSAGAPGTPGDLSGGLGYSGPNITGYDPTLAGLGISMTLGHAPGLAGLGAMAAGKALGLGPNANLTYTDENGNLNPAVALYSGISGKFGLPSGFLGFNNSPEGQMAQQLMAAYPQLANDPEFMGSMSVGAHGLGNPTGPTPSPFGLSPVTPNPFADPTPTTPPSPKTGIGVDEPEGGQGTPGSSPPGNTDTGAPGGGGSGAGESGAPFKRGGIVTKPTQHGMKFHPGFARKKGTEVVPIKAHEGEFVVNKNATDAFKPVLSAMNDAIPAQGDSKKFAAAMQDAKDFFDV